MPLSWKQALAWTKELLTKGYISPSHTPAAFLHIAEEYMALAQQAGLPQAKQHEHRTHSIAAASMVSCLCTLPSFQARDGCMQTRQHPS